MADRLQMLLFLLSAVVTAVHGAVLAVRPWADFTTSIAWNKDDLRRAVEVVTAAPVPPQLLAVAKAVLTMDYQHLPIAYAGNKVDQLAEAIFASNLPDSTSRCDLLLADSNTEMAVGYALVQVLGFPHQPASLLKEFPGGDQAYFSLFMHCSLAKLRQATERFMAVWDPVEVSGQTAVDLVHLKIPIPVPGSLRPPSLEEQMMRMLSEQQHTAAAAFVKAMAMADSHTGPLTDDVANRIASGIRACPRYLDRMKQLLLMGLHDSIKTVVLAIAHHDSSELVDVLTAFTPLLTTIKTSQQSLYEQVQAWSADPALTEAFIKPKCLQRIIQRLQAGHQPNATPLMTTMRGTTEAMLLMFFPDFEMAAYLASVANPLDWQMRVLAQLAANFGTANTEFDADYMTKFSAAFEPVLPALRLKARVEERRFKIPVHPVGILPSP